MMGHDGVMMGSAGGAYRIPAARLQLARGTAALGIPRRRINRKCAPRGYLSDQCSAFREIHGISFGSTKYGMPKGVYGISTLLGGAIHTSCRAPLACLAYRVFKLYLA